MGLDMFLNGEKFIWGDFKNPANNPTEDGFPVKSRKLELGYWREHPNLHGFIVNEFAGGKDDCSEIYLDADKIKRIMEAVRDEFLPHTEGFFFGVSDGSEKEETLQIFAKALEWLETKEEGISRSVFYQASW
jgi:hypothetical protein